MSSEEILKGRVTKGPVSDPNSYFAAVDVEDTPRVMAALRQAGMRFSVSVNPHPEPDETKCDVFWFYPQGDEETIQSVISETLENK